jgi:5-formyltetrahydrofolate cyclo-ligase
MAADAGVRGAKRDLRARMLEARRRLGAAERARADERIRRNVAGLPEFARAHVLLAYLAMGEEVETRGIIRDAWAAGKAVALPRVEGPHRMSFYLVDPGDGFEGALVRSSFGVLEPPADPARRLAPQGPEAALAVVPGLAFDRAGLRLGYGGGFYDAYLAGFCGATAGLCREASLVDALETEPHDLPVGVVVTEEGCLRTR